MPLERSIGSKHRPKILLIENSRHVTGAFNSALDMAESLRADYDIEFVLPATSTLAPLVIAREISCHVLPMSELGRSWRKLVRYLPMLVLNSIRLRKLLDRRKVDVLVVNDYYNLLGAAVRLTGWRGTVLTMVRLIPFNQQPLLNRVWTALGHRLSHRMVAVSRAVAAQLPSSPRVVVVYDPMKLDGPLPTDSSGDTPSNGKVRLLYLANYIAGKGHHVALQAFATAYETNKALRLRFVGGDMGLSKNRELKADLHRQVAELGLNGVIQIDDYTDNVRKSINGADIVLNFSESESFSRTCAEACAFGRPVIATRCGGPEEIIEDGMSGLLVPTGDVAKMAAAILRLANDPALCRAMGQAGSRIVSERFSTERFATEFSKLCAPNVARTILASAVHDG